MYRGLPSAHRDNLPVASRIADQVLCLPMYPALRDADLDRIVEIGRQTRRRGKKEEPRAMTPASGGVTR